MKSKTKDIIALIFMIVAFVFLLYGIIAGPSYGACIAAVVSFTISVIIARINLK